MMALGKIQDETLYATHRYYYSQLFLVEMSVIAAIIVLPILKEDKKTDGTTSTVQEIDEEMVKLTEEQ